MRSAPAAAACRKPWVSSFRAPTGDQPSRRALLAASEARSPDKPRRDRDRGSDQAGFGFPDNHRNRGRSCDGSRAATQSRSRHGGNQGPTSRSHRRRSTPARCCRAALQSPAASDRRERIRVFGRASGSVRFVLPLAGIERGQYNPTMRRPTRLGLAVVAVLLILLGAYTAYWLIIARRITDGVAAWAQTERAEKIDASWERIGVAGFPFACRVELENAMLRDGRLTPSPELRVPAVSASARPWDFASWRMVAPGGLSAA